LRALAEEWAAAAALPIQRERAELWRRLNDLEPVRPLVWINEIPWHEMNVDDELTLRCQDPFAREHEVRLRQALYQWRHMPGDMILEPVYDSPLVVHDSGFGITEDVDIARTDAASGIVSRHFHLQIQDEADLAKIKTPVITHDADASLANAQRLRDCFGDILPVRLRGAPGFWFAPWDELIRWWGVQEAMLDLKLRPALVHAFMDRLTNAYLARLDQFESLGLLASNANNTRIGSGGYGYTDHLPAPEGLARAARCKQLWGCATAQIFSDVSPRMHVEFALQYESRWLRRWGLTYYGCCEPLHLKVDMLRQHVPNLRKISMSPWIDLRLAADKVGRDFVFSRKPNPAIFAEDTFNEARARADLTEVLDVAGGCNVELIMKDISTVRYQPQRLWRWAEIAREVVEG
jgi:hypothetical protein